jgi:hypothetical protein
MDPLPNRSGLSASDDCCTIDRVLFLTSAAFLFSSLKARAVHALVELPRSQAHMRSTIQS